MDTTSLLLISAGIFFLLVWVFIGWLKFREHSNTIHHEPRQKTHITHFFRRQRDSENR